MPTQREAGKAFEFAFIETLFQNLSLSIDDVRKTENSSLLIAKECFEKFSDQEKMNFNLAAQVDVEHLPLLEPNLVSSGQSADFLTLSIVPDNKGVQGDVRDIIILRSERDWEIGISAKNHHRAVKHSRLSDSIDFGN